MKQCFINPQDHVFQNKPSDVVGYTCMNMFDKKETTQKSKVKFKKKTLITFEGKKNIKLDLTTVIEPLDSIHLASSLCWLLLISDVL